MISELQAINEFAKF